MRRLHDVPDMTCLSGVPQDPSRQYQEPTPLEGSGRLQTAPDDNHHPGMSAFAITLIRGHPLGTP